MCPAGMCIVSVKADAQPPHLTCQSVYSALTSMACIATAYVKSIQLDMQTAPWFYITVMFYLHMFAFADLRVYWLP